MNCRERKERASTLYNQTAKAATSGHSPSVYVCVCMGGREATGFLESISWKWNPHNYIYCASMSLRAQQQHSEPTLSLIVTAEGTVDIVNATFQSRKAEAFKDYAIETEDLRVVIGQTGLEITSA